MTATQTIDGLAGLDPETESSLSALPETEVPKGAILFRPGDAAKGFVILLEGRIEVFLTGPTGRELLLYAVEPGSSCVQSTLGLLGGEDYSGEAVAASDCRLVMVPRGLFLGLMARSEVFRHFVFTTFAARMQGMMQVLERVAFQRVECRLAQALTERAANGRVQATHQELATAIGSAREVVSRRIEAFTRQGWVVPERGAVRIADEAALRRLAAADI